jgi:hypothetical protein
MVITLHIDKKFEAQTISFLKTLPYVKIEESPYDPAFVKKVKDSEKKKGIILDPKNPWKSLEL